MEADYDFSQGKRGRSIQYYLEKLVSQSGYSILKHSLGFRHKEKVPNSKCL